MSAAHAGPCDVGDAVASTVWGAATDPGRRASNEDAHLAEHPVFVVADGMGGHEAGGVASATAVDAFRALVGRTPVTTDDVRAALHEAAGRVRAIPTAHGRDAGTTVAAVVAVVSGGLPYWVVANLGDSRVYRLADGVLEQVSVDHSEVQEMVDRGEIDAIEARTHPRRHVVTRALGAFGSALPDYWLLPAGSHDRMLLCSDGLTSELPDGHITAVLLEEPVPQRCADRLVRDAVAAGGRDNVTVLVVDLVHADGDETQTAPRGVPVPGTADDDTVPRGPVGATKGKR